MAEDEVQKILCNLKAFFEREKEEKIPILIENVLYRMEMATGIPKRTICRRLEPKKPPKKKGRMEINIDDFDMKVIARRVHEFYQNKEFPTLDKLLQVLRQDINFPGKEDGVQV